MALVSKTCVPPCGPCCRSELELAYDPAPGLMYSVPMAGADTLTIVASEICSILETYIDIPTGKGAPMTQEDTVTCRAG